MHHGRVEMAHAARLYLVHGHADRAHAFRVGRRLDIALDDAHGVPLREKRDGAHEERRLARSRGAHEVERDDAVRAQVLPVLRGDFPIAVPKILSDPYLVHRFVLYRSAPSPAASSSVRM